MKVKITKRSEAPGGLPAIAASEHKAGKPQPDGFSIPIDYWLTGEMLRPIKVGESVVVQRDTRNGVPMAGTFITSAVVSFDDKSFRTMNSIYEYSVLTPDDQSITLSA